MSNPHSPVLIGVGQIEQRLDDPTAGLEPTEMMVLASERAAEDAAATFLLTQVDSVRVIRGAWPYGNPAKFVAEKIGARSAQTVGTPFGGNMVQFTVNQTAREILAGDRELVLITGAENGKSTGKARKIGIRLATTSAPGEYDRILGDDKPMASEAELARGLRRATPMYAIFENAIRHARGESIEDHVIRISELWSRFNEVATGNPHAWIKDRLDAKTIRTVASDNRMISFPYPKLMNANNRVDMGAALIMCSVQKAKALGVSPDRWVYIHAGTDAHDHDFVSERDNLYSSPAIRISGQKLLDVLDLSLDDFSFVDLYSCFPSAVQVAASELGLSEAQPLTVTGGLTFGGGPLNNYVMHSIARTVELVRASPGARGLVTANGGYLTKHAMGVYSTDAPASDFQCIEVQDEVDALPKRDCVVDHDGDVTIESYTVMFGADGPTIGHVACLLPDGRRTWANTEDQDVMSAMTREEFCGRSGRVDGTGNLAIR